MKVLQVVKTNRGATWALNQAISLKKLGVEVVTILPNTEDGNAVKYKENGLEIIAGDWNLPIKKPWKYFKIKKEIQKTVKEVSPDIIHLHFITNVWMGRLALRKDKTPRFFQVPGPQHLKIKITNFVERATSTKVDYWGGGCKRSCQYYFDKGISKNRVFLTYYGVSTPTIDNIDKRILHTEFGIPDNKKIVAMICYFYKPKKFLGEFKGLKGHEDFIDAMKIVLQKRDDVIPVVIGNAWTGAEKYAEQVIKYAKKQLGDNIIFTGYRSDIYDLYPEIALAVHPSHTENLGGAAESLMLGVPTVSTNVGGFPDIVIPGETGLLAEPKNPKDLADKIDWMLSHPQEGKDMALHGKDIVTELLSYDNTAKKVYEAYLKILGEEKSEDGSKHT